MSDRESTTSSKEFLLAEFNALQQRATQLEQIKSSAINFFLLIVAATVTGTPTLATLITNNLFKNILLTIAPLLIFIFGLLTLNNSIDLSVAAVAHLRRAGRIRRWFVEQNSMIERYVAWEPVDDRPRIYVPRLSFRGSEVAVSFINIICASLVAFTTLSYLHLPSSIIFSPFVGVITWYVQRYFVKKKLKHAEELDRQNVYFPHQDRLTAQNSKHNQEVENEKQETKKPKAEISSNKPSV